MANPDIPEREVYWVDGQDDGSGTVMHAIEDFCEDCDTVPETITLCGANWVRDDDGECVEVDEDDDQYAVCDRIRIKINLREWCVEHDALDLIERKEAKGA